MKDLYDFIKGFDLHTIIVVGIAFWWLNGNIKELDSRLSEKINNLSERVARIEGILSHQGYCATNVSEKELK
jgi:hypothetical protein